MKLKSALKRAGLAVGVDITRARTRREAAWNALNVALSYRTETSTPVDQFIQFCAANLARSHAQVFQDAFVLFETGSKQGGFFVEFGATDGVTLSNTCLLEQEYSWRGILAEPARGWHTQLTANRSCIVDTRCVTGRTGNSVMFVETPWKEVSTIEHYVGDDNLSGSRKNGERYEVQTVSLTDLLVAHGAPAEFEYLSIDTEGSELEILQAFDFKKHSPAIITVEHNYVDAKRTGLQTLLLAQGYERRFTELSYFDDWYVLPSRVR